MDPDADELFVPMITVALTVAETLSLDRYKDDR